MLRLESDVRHCGTDVLDIASCSAERVTGAKGKKSSKGEHGDQDFRQIFHGAILSGLPVRGKWQSVFFGYFSQGA